MAGPTGQAVAFDADTGMPIPEAETAQALADGRAAFKRDAEVYMRDPATGRAVVLPAQNAARALAEGFSVMPQGEVAEKLASKAKQEQYGGLASQVGTALEGAASAVTLGGYDLASKNLGFDVAERAEANPGARTTGEVVGTVGSLFIPGGAAVKGAGTAAKAGAVARAATVAPRAIARGAEALGARAGAAIGKSTMSGRLLSKAAQYGVSGAVEGAAYGAGQVISEAALKDQELTAEMLLSGAVEGATMGGLLGGVVGAGTGLLGEAGRKLGASGGKLRALADKEAGLAVLGGDKRGLKKVLSQGGEERLQALGKRAHLDTELMSNPQKALEVVKREADDSVARLKSVQKQLDDAGTRIERAGMVNAIDAQIAKAGTGLTGDARAVGKGLIKQLKPLRQRLADDAAGELSFSEAWDYRRALDDVINWDKSVTGKQTALGEAIINTRSMISQKLDDAAESLSPELKATWKKANADYSDWATLRGVMKTRAEKDLGKSLVQSGDTLSAAAGIASGLATGSTLTGLATGALLGGANRLIRDRGHEFIARAANRLAKTDEMMDDAARAMTGQRLKAPRRAIAPTAVALAERYERAREETIDASPSAIQGRMAQATQGLEDQPGLLTAIHAGVAADAAYLQAQLPQPDVRSPATSLTPSKPTKPSRSAMSTFVSKAEALKDPAGVMADVAQGHVDLAAIQALKDRRPAIYRDMRKRVMIYAAQRGEALPYKQRVTLSLAFDFTADPSMNPATMASIQGSFVPPESPAADGQGGQSGPQRKIETDTTDEQLPGETSASN